VGLLLNREFTILPSSIPSLAIWLTGVIPIVDMQRAIEKTVSQAAHLQYSQPMLILCEHEKAITVGRSGSRQDIACSDEDLALQGIPLMFIGRGGGAVMHAPGQLGIYLFGSLESLGYSIDTLGIFIDRFHEGIKRALLDVRANPIRHDTMHGLFGRTGLLAAIGLSVRHGVVCHGAFVNVSSQCGIARRVFSTRRGPMGSIESDLQRRVGMASVRSCIVTRLCETLGVEPKSVQSGFPFREVQAKNKGVRNVG